jgi:hypothetical protein
LELYTVINQEAILQAAATIAAAKIQVGGALAVAAGEKAVKALAKVKVDSTEVLVESIKEVLAAVTKIERNKSDANCKIWAELGK